MQIILQFSEQERLPAKPTHKHDKLNKTCQFFLESGQATQMPYLWLFFILLLDGVHLIYHKMIDFGQYWLENILDIFAVQYIS